MGRTNIHSAFALQDRLARGEEQAHVLVEGRYDRVGWGVIGGPALAGSAGTGFIFFQARVSLAGVVEGRDEAVVDCAQGGALFWAGQ